MTGSFSAEQAAQATEHLQAVGGSHGFAHGSATVAGRHAATLRSERDVDGERWAALHYFVRDPDELWVIVVGSSDLDRDTPVFDRIVQSFEILPIGERGERPVAAHDRLANPMIKLIPQARVIAAGLRHETVGTEHLLLAMLADDNLGARVLEDQGVTYESMRSELEQLSPPVPNSSVRSMSPDAYVALNRTGPWLADQHGTGRMGADHLLMAILDDEHAVGHKLLVELGVDPHRARSAIQRLWEQRAGR